jgi:sec-independent protein translocase protein TatA
MFGLGIWEIALILVAALIFIGPAKLPDLARTLGKGTRDLRRAMAGFEDEVKRATTLPPEMGQTEASKAAHPHQEASDTGTDPIDESSTENAATNESSTEHTPSDQSSTEHTPSDQSSTEHTPSDQSSTEHTEMGSGDSSESEPAPSTDVADSEKTAVTER